jgi:Tol biopolymer transport system component
LLSKLRVLIGVGIVSSILVTSLMTARAETNNVMGTIIFASNRTGTYQIYLKDLATNLVTNLSNNRYNDMNAQPSPDGSKIVFYSDRAGNNQIYQFDLAAPTVVTRLTNDGASDYDPSFMPDGRILYKSNLADGYGDIWLMNADGTGQRNLTPSFRRTEEWKPDAISNDKIIFTSRTKRGQSSSDELYMLDLTTNVTTRLTTNTVADWYPEVSPDGTKVAYISKDRSRDPDSIYTMSPDGTNIRKLTDKSKIRGDSDDPSWSPDGQNIVFVNNSKGNYNIYVMSADGTNIRLLESSRGNELSPYFVPATPPATPAP